MREGKIDIINRLGIHARAAAKLVNTATAFESEIMIGNDCRMVNAKSIMSVMMLAASCGSRLQLTAQGTDEEEAFAAVTTLIANRFDEPE